MTGERNSDRKDGRARWWIVVLSWNDREETLSCLECLRELWTVDVGIVVVDQGSTDGSVELIRTRFPNAVLIQNDRNLGFAEGNNLGIRHGLAHGAEWVMLLNNDARLASDAVTALDAAAAQYPSAGVLSPVIFYDDPPDRIWFAGQRFNPRFGYSGRARGYRRRDRGRYRRVFDTDRAAGAAMAISSRVLRDVGLLDAELFFYVEEVELCLRARNAGHRILIIPEARAWHKISQTSGGEFKSDTPLYYGTRNTIAVAERHLPLGRFGTQVRRFIIVLTFLQHAVRRFPGLSGAAGVIQGFRDARAGRFGPRAAR
jgi:GT2 family glycosyltransferase